VRQNVEPGSMLYTDSAEMYRDLNGEFVHKFVDHLSEYVNWRVHTNGMENFWSLLKRTLEGTYVSVDPVHLFRYLYNYRKLTDAERFVIVLSYVIGKRLTYAELTGKVHTPAVQQ
jgi:hypothetical protein